MARLQSKDTWLYPVSPTGSTWSCAGNTPGEGPTAAPGGRVALGPLLLLLVAPPPPTLYTLDQGHTQNLLGAFLSLLFWFRCPFLVPLGQGLYSFLHLSPISFVVGKSKTAVSPKKNNGCCREVVGRHLIFWSPSLQWSGPGPPSSASTLTSRLQPLLPPYHLP